MRRLLCLALLLTSAPALARDATLTWTAPRDNFAVVAYEVRYKTISVSGTDTTGWWANAATVTGLPLPSLAGLTDSVRVTGLDPARPAYFIIRSIDGSGNVSPFSNISYLPPLAAVDTGRPEPVRNLIVR